MESGFSLLLVTIFRKGVHNPDHDIQQTVLVVYHVSTERHQPSCILFLPFGTQHGTNLNLRKKKKDQAGVFSVDQGNTSRRCRSETSTIQ